MPRCHALLLASLALVVAASAQPPTAQEIAVGWRADRLIVKPKPGAIRRAVPMPGVRVLRDHPRVGGMQTLAVTGGGLAGKIAALQASGLYEYVERDWIVHASVEPNDPRYASGELWGLHNTGQSGGANDADVDGPEAWDVRHDAPGVIVAVIDTGVRSTHEDLAANMWRNPGESGDGKETNGLDDDGDGWIDNVFGIDAVNQDGNPADDHSHGTHCAGTVAALGNNGAGVTGVAWQAQIMACKFLAASGSGSTSDAIVCIDFARSKGAHILSNSWGGGGYSQALRDAIAAARAAGIVFVAAAGNDNRDNDAVANYPSNYEEDNVVAVASTTRTDTRSGFSNFGLGLVELGAPGSEILSVGHTSDSAYTIKSGTSMATPHVAGALALLKAQFPADHHRQLINRLLRGVNPIPALAGQALTGGRLNVAGALVTTTGAPFHDDFAAAPILTQPKFRLRSANVAATLETNEPLHAGDATGAASVWWRWTAPASGLVGVSTAGSRFDTLLAVYTGSAVEALTLVASDDDVSAGVATSELRFTATAGTTYAIAIAGKAGATGLAMCSLGPPPPNDDFTNAAMLTGASVEVTNASNLYASKESGEPAHAGNAGRASVWWTWTAPESAVFLASTAGSAFDTLAAVYTGSSVDALTLVAENDDDPGVTTSRVLFSAVAGTTYRIAVDGKNGATGAGALLVAKPPANDAFADRLTLSGTPASASGSNLGATKEADEPNHANNSGGVSVWWTWTAPAASTVVIDTLGSDFDTTLAVYTGGALGALTALASNDDTVGLTSRVSFEASAGATYQIAVDGYDGDTGSISLALAVPAPPANDAFANRVVIANLGLAATADSEGATKEPGEPEHAGRVGGKSAWWKWTAPGPGTATFHTTGSSFDTVLAVYLGGAVTALTAVAGDHNSGTNGASVVTFTATGGVTYQFAVDGYNGAGGAITLRGSFTPTQVPPVAVPDVLVHVEPGVTTEFDVLFNDTDANGDLLFITGVSGVPADAVVTHDGTVAYFRGGASLAATGVNTFSYAITDGRGGTATGLATVYRRPIDQWRAEHFGLATGDPAIAGDDADPNGNGLVNLLEYALGGDPLAASVSVLPQAARDPLTGRLVLDFTRHPGRDDLVLTVQGADAPGGPWTNLARSELGAPFIPLVVGVGAGETAAGDAQAVRVSDQYPMSDPAHPHRWLRLEVVRP